MNINSKRNTTEQSQAYQFVVEKLRQSEAQYLAIVDTQADCICRFLPDCTLTFVNLSYCYYFGRSRETLIGTNFLTLIPPSDRPNITEMLETISPERPTYVHKHQVIDSHGTLRWLQWTNQGIFDDNGKLVEFQAIGRDVTDLQQVERALNLSEDRLRAIAEGIRDTAVYTLDLEGRVLTWNATAAHLYGYRDREMVGVSFERLFSSPDTPRTLLQQARSLGQVDYEHWQVRQNGDRLWTWGILQRLDDADGNVIGFAHTVSDRSIENDTERARTYLADSLARSERFLRHIIDLVPHPIFAKDRDGFYLLLNQATADFFGRSIEDILGRRDIDLAPSPEIAQQWRASDLEVSRNRRTKTRYPEILEDPSGCQHIFETTTFPLVVDGEVSGVLGIAIDVTERQEVLDALRESEERFRQMAEAISDVFFLYSGGFDEAIYISPACQAIWGYPAEAFYGRPNLWVECVYHDDREAVWMQLQNMRERDLAIEYRIVRPNGSLRWLRTRTFPLRDETGETHRIVGVTEDITEQQIATIALNQAYETLRDREARYRTLTTGAPVGIFQTDGRGRIDFVNQRWCDIVGLPLAAVYDGRWMSAIHPDDRDGFFQHWNRIRTETLSWEFRFVRPDGRIAWVLAHSSPVNRGRGRDSIAIGTLLDISDRKQAEVRLQQLSSALEQSADDVIITDRDGTIVYVNSGFERLTGYCKTEALGRTPSLLKSGRHDRHFYDRLWATITSGREFHAVFTNRRKSGELFDEQKTIVPIRDERGEIVNFVSTGKDVTERQRAEARLERINQCFLNFGNDPMENVERLTALCGELLGAFRVSYCRWQNARLTVVCQWANSPFDATFEAIDVARNALNAGNNDWFVRGTTVTEWGQTVRTRDSAAAAAAAHRDRDRQPSSGFRLVGALCSIHRASFVPSDDDRRVLGIVASAIAVEEEQYRVEEALRRQMEQERAIALVARHIHCSLELSEILQTTVDEVRHFLQCDRVLVCCLDTEAHGRIVAESIAANCQSAFPATFEFDRACLQGYRRGESCQVSCTTPLQPEPFDVLACQVFDIGSQLVMPILQGEQLWGLLLVQQCYETREWHSSEEAFVRQLAIQVGIATQQSQLYQQLKAANDELQRLATIDGLTQVGNRRQFDEFLATAWHRARSQCQPLGSILCDIDFFKAYNDTYGHQAGDECLKKVAATIETAVSSQEALVARYGGEEFVVVLPETDADGVVRVMKAIRTAVRRLKVPHSRSTVSGWVTLSLGGASLVPPEAATPDLLLNRADRALYRAKQGGRNRYCCHQTEKPTD
ncbi:diguanylate cyclase/phosphodiesterase (GGDEF & EAL domains) with PAS/PAC sensor(s) [Geitlerinema sp. FC II]|nr:diguanylate cyclase/phosphodiesterase (GGDEF & EAL domains) with PAS/PAC sensor(s) [Geitlerinema sp. FC II]